MKKLLLMIGIGVFSYAANGPTMDQPQSPQMQQKGTYSDCSHLSTQEKQFALQLSDMHRTMFCRHFSVSQRIEAMTLASPAVEKLTGQNVNISPDEAVEVVMKNARQSQPNGSSPQQQQQGQNPYSNY